MGRRGVSGWGFGAFVHWVIAKLVARTDKAKLVASKVDAVDAPAKSSYPKAMEVILVDRIYCIGTDTIYIVGIVLIVGYVEGVVGFAGKTEQAFATRAEPDNTLMIFEDAINRDIKRHIAIDAAIVSEKPFEP